ncbi:hypothetical protein [Pelomonas cellulosilytica]|uniref:Uncharacterized protein n=1 Tax=Pelomonas cellulosilytica TaxID=2906762 RepID=A0ABS8Y2K8_9BURK|nr:hypothetical protein [Pelomonas sp. P8]MCE4556140.1 hypothetical protein [Pelomonas sp. P8]
MGAMTASALLGYLVCGAAWVVHYRNCLAKLRDMGTPIAEFTAQDESFPLISGIRTASMKWSCVIEVWRFDGFLLLSYPKRISQRFPSRTSHQKCSPSCWTESVHPVAKWTAERHP